ncbi:poly(A) RNA polymerase GLD2-like [Pyrus ussuriensis x Pyrus communis]|uniref:Poly(A) RNA polymerase GLD2-like n=1 Tax=Pyrus ussuriensis x Pyrus communis TaxID=2448454 RepID=A0A5N5F4V3_9ROSA|nr:poly(A) RNA polymerase GLD2-like [Pyrus ussuriensis x Pyrus communis]
MASTQKELRNEAKQLEFLELEKYRITPVCISKLDNLLHDLYAIRRPKSIDYHIRRDVIRIFNAISKELYGNSDNSPVVEVFGSFVMDMFSVGSDLVLSVNFGNISRKFPREMKIRTLRKFDKKFYSLQRGGHVVGVQTIMSARVPIIKFIHFENRDGIQKSQILHIVCGIDERFQKLNRTLSSLSIIQLVAFHLRTRDPPIIPPLSTLFEDGTDPVIVVKRVKNYLELEESNKESLADLFVTLLVMMASVENLWQKGLCASLYEGCWTSILWDTQYNAISVEDFADRSQNVARAVGREQFKEIYGCIHSSLSHLLAFCNDQTQGHKLLDLLFSADLVTIPRHIDTESNEEIEANISLPLNGHLTKRRRVK